MQSLAPIPQIQPPSHPHSNPTLTTPNSPINPSNFQSAKQEKSMLHGVENEISALENRIMLLKQQQAKEKQMLSKNKQRTKQVIDKKIQISEIQKLKQRDTSSDVEKVELLKRRNQQMRVEHQRQMNTILKACYLVKLDEARQLKNLSMQHQRKIKQIKGEIYEQKLHKKQHIKNLTDNSKKKYREYWRNRLSELYTSQEMTAQEIAQQKAEKARYLKELEEQEIKLLERINKVHEHSVESKKEYLTALNIPVKEIGELVQHSSDRSDRRVNSSMDDSKTVKAETEVKSHRSHAAHSTHNSPMKIPKANLNEAKLRHILNELKKNEGEAMRERKWEKEKEQQKQPEEVPPAPQQ